MNNASLLEVLFGCDYRIASAMSCHMPYQSPPTESDNSLLLLLTEETINETDSL